jgi:chromosome segregation protein
LHLKRLEIVGFKSFADAFELQFQEGISAIVGPNGCGKSNIADSIRWVLGSQSPRQLRADRMEDVIFSGSDQRKPLGMAEVVLTFDNADRALPLDFDEVSVTRRVYRAGEGDYRINSNRCRLMDVTDLIVDRGLGSSGYWILEAKMVETILSSRPEDRRFLFDEAAGIVKYKIQRHRAELKLDAASTDLERLKDIVSEVERTAAGLKKQVATFRRYEKAETRVNELEGLLVHLELTEAADLKKSLSREDTDISGQEEGLAAAVSAAGARLAESRLGLEKAQTSLDAAHALCAELDGRIADAERERAVTAERISAAEAASEEHTTRIAWQKARHDELVQAAETSSAEIEELRRELESMSADAGGASEKTAAARVKQEETGGRLEELRTRRNVIENSLEESREEYAQCLAGRERMIQELQNLASRKEQLEEKGDGLRSTAAKMDESLGEITVELRKAGDGLDVEEVALSGLSDRAEATRDHLHELNANTRVLRTRIEGLRSAETPGDRHEDSLSARLGVRKGTEMAVGAFLEGFQDALVLSDPGQLEGDDGSRFLMTVADPDSTELPEGAVRLSSLMEGDDSALEALLSRGILAPDRDTATNWFLDRCPLDIVTEEGDLFRRDGLVRLGMSSSDSGVLERSALLEQASDELEGLEKEITEVSARLDEENTLCGELSGKITGLREAKQILEREEASKKAALEAVHRQVEENGSELERLGKQIPVLEKSIETDRGSGLAAKIEELRKGLDDCTVQLRNLEDEGILLTEALNEALRHENEIGYRVRSLGEKTENAERERERLGAEAAGALKTAEELEQKVSGLSERKSGLVRKAEELEQILSGLQEEREKAEGERTAASSSRAEALEETGRLDSSLQEQREQLSLVREKRAVNASELASLTQRISQLEESEIVLPQENSRYWDFDADRIRSELAKQMNFRENIGPVNMLAVQEFEEARERLDYLSGQMNDLEEARESLRQAIEEINLTAARRFAETFIEVRKNFQELFRRLFGGGEADIISLEGDDPLEGGVQIMARPRGKKMENVTALSGGERALTAVALLFALYLVKPSPFCILDELDAPLDDSNIDRFIDLLRSFVDRTQFVIITHNKRTMEAADRLFGITMEEDGVSVLTTVSLQDLPDTEERR